MLRRSKETKRELLKGLTKSLMIRSLKLKLKKKNKSRESERFKNFWRTNKKRSKLQMRQRKPTLFKIQTDSKFYKVRRKILWSFHQARANKPKNKPQLKSVSTCKLLRLSSFFTQRLQKRKKNSLLLLRRQPKESRSLKEKNNWRSNWPRQLPNPNSKTCQRAKKSRRAHQLSTLSHSPHFNCFWDYYFYY